MSQVDGVTDMVSTCRLCGSVGGGLKKGTMASACAFLSGGSCPPSSHPDTRHFSSSPYATRAFQAAALVVLELRGSESE